MTPGNKSIPAEPSLRLYTETCKLRLMKYKQKSARDKALNWDASSVRSLRDHIGLTQQEMAERLGVRQQTISEWENQAYRPRGASVTLLRMVAEDSGFKYEAG